MQLECGEKWRVFVLASFFAEPVAKCAAGMNAERWSEHAHYKLALSALQHCLNLLLLPLIKK